MPIYAFECTACGHSYDRLQKLSDPDPVACPVCAADTVKRQLTAPSFRLSGSGWYETDFKKGGDKQRNLAEKGEGAAAKPETGTETPSAGLKPESKPESKSESKVEAKPAAAPAPVPKPVAGTS